jgi:adenylate cyclase
VRVTAQLIDAETGHQIWAGKYDGALDDIFEIQDEITRQIVSVVEPEMEKAERIRSATKRATNLTAWDYYLQGRELVHGLVPAQNARARELFETALKLDPDYSDAWAGLSQTYTRDILLHTTHDRAECEKRAIETAQKAVSLDGASSVAHLALGTAYTWANQNHVGIAETRLAAELNPSNSLAWLALGNRLDIAGETDEGIALMERSLELHSRDPHGHIYLGQLARAHIVAGSYEKALDLLNRALVRRPDYPHTYHLLAICLGHLGRVDEARAAARKCDEIHPGFMAKRTPWNIYLDPEANDQLTEGLRKAGLAD